LIVKWGLYKPGKSELLLFPNSRKPNVVIYNNVQNLSDNFSPWFKKGNKCEYLFLGVSKNHPFQIILIKDSGNVLHFVNTFKGPASQFIDRYKKSLIKTTAKNFLKNTKDYNNALCVWGGMPWEIDWYKSMLDGKKIHTR